MKMMCFDMDGTIADFYGYSGWLGCLNAEDPAPYIYANPLWDMKALNFVLRKLQSEGWQIRVISWLAKDSTEDYKQAVRQAKLEWLQKYNFPLDGCHLVQYGTTKADCVRRYYDSWRNIVLVDDNEKVRNGWHLGETIDPMNCGSDLPRYLCRYLNNPAEGEKEIERMGV